MKVQAIKYERKFNLGNFETECIGIDAVLDEGDELALVFSNIKALAFQFHAVANPSPPASDDGKAAEK